MSLLFQYLNYTFDIILWPFSSLPAYVDIFFISIVSAVIFLFIIKKTSKQDKIKHHKQRIYGHIIQIFIYKDQLRVIFQSILGILKHNILYIGYMLPPLIFIVIPLWIFVTQINNRFGYSPLEKDQTFIIRLGLDKEKMTYNDNLLRLVHTTTSDGIIIETDPLRIISEGSIYLRARVTDSTVPLTVRFNIDNHQEEQVKNVITIDNKGRFAPEKNKYQLWKALTTNAETFIPDSSPFKSVSFSYQRQSYPFIFWDIDPIIIYFILTLIFGFLLKSTFRVNI